MDTIDVRGRSCPEPVIMTKNALDKNPSGVKVLADAQVSVENIKRLVTNKGYNIVIEENKGEYTLNIKK